MNPFNLKNNLALLVISATLFSCSKDTDLASSSSAPVTNMQDLVAPSGFGFETQRNYQLNLSFSTLNNNDLQGIRFQLADKPLDLGGKVLFTGISDQNGEFNGSASLPSGLQEVVLVTYALGIPQNQVITLNSSNLSYFIGGTNPSNLQSYEVKYPNAYAGLQSNGSAGMRTLSAYASKTSFRLGRYDTDGKPLYLEPTRDAIPDEFMQNINYSLPEMRPVPQFNPQYLNDQHERNIQITQTSDVFVTFVTEGAGFRNTLMYYVYDKNNPPRTVADIDSFYMMIPNASLVNSGGSMRPGEKIKIGRFGSNKTIGFALVADGWRGGSGTGILPNNWILFSDKNLNPEADPNKKQHTVLLWDQTTQRFVYGFEDVRRDYGSDEDFNDCIFYVTSNPVPAIDPTKCLKTQNPRDADNDGVKDDQDEYPSDPLRAYNNYSTVSTLAFEDLWPSTGDYDFNDLVVGYKINRVTNASNRVVDIKGQYWLKAIGASYKNGFGIELNVPANAVQSVSGMRLEPSTYVQLNANGTEAGNPLASFVVFDNAFKVLKPTGDGFVNTTPGRPRSSSDTVSVNLTFVTAQDPATLGQAPFNPFLIQNQNRSVEIHLPNKKPTALANINVLGTKNDKSDVRAAIYYRTANRLPWAIQLPVSFDYPTEKTAIIEAYPRFADWATSGGASFPDWYTTAPGNRNPVKIY